MTRPATAKLTYTSICMIIVRVKIYTSRYTIKTENKILQKTAEYALRAAVWLARDPASPQSADHLANATRIPRRYLHKVLQDLVRADLVRSQPGPGGGYALERDPEEIAILDVINAVEPIGRIRSCPLGLASHTTLCPLHRELDQAFATVEAAFARVTLAQILDRPGRITPLCDCFQAAVTHAGS